MSRLSDYTKTAMGCVLGRIANAVGAVIYDLQDFRDASPTISAIID
jgi:hypothetical protein